MDNGAIVTGYIHRPNSMPIRQPQRIEMPDAEHQDTHLIVASVLKLHEQLSNLATLIKDQTRTFDIYRPQTLSPDSETTITLQPEYEKPEVVQAIIITGPAGAVTLQLGERIWSLSIPATGIIVISRVALKLSRADPRILTASAAGDYTLELMGYADES